MSELFIEVGIGLDHVLKLLAIDLIDTTSHFNLLDIASVLKVFFIFFKVRLHHLIGAFH